MTSRRPCLGSHAPEGTASREPRITTGTTGSCARAAAAKAPAWKRPSPGSRRNVPSGKKASASPAAAARRMRRVSTPPRWRSKRSTNCDPIRRSNRCRNGTLVSFALDDEAEAGRQGSREDHAIEIARVIRDDNAGPRADLLGAARCERNASTAKEMRAQRRARAAPPRESRRHDEQDETDDRDDADGDDRVEAIDAISITGSRSRGRVGERIRIHKMPSETVTGFKLMSMSHVNRITADPVFGTANLRH